VHIEINEPEIAVQENVQGACEILGFDPLYLANEGRFVALVPQDQAERALAALHALPISSGAAAVGNVDEGSAGRLTLHSRIGTRRILDMLTGEQLPRIC
jgi:hydrogenase expression/formation protein HypE